MPTNRNLARRDRVSLLETIIAVRETTRDKAVQEALEHARIAVDEHDAKHAREAMRKREFAEWLDEGIERNRAELSKLRGF